MILTLRKKLILGFIGLDIGVSLLFGIFMYQLSYTMFVENFKNHKLSIARFISKGIKGEEHEQFNSAKNFQSPEFLKYINFLEKIYKSETNVRYIYTLNYNPKTDKFYYAIDATKVDRDTVWVESELFAYNIFVSDKNELFANYNYYLRSGKFEIENQLFGKIKHELITEGNTHYLKINDHIILTFKSLNPLRIVHRNEELNERHNFISAKLKLNQQEISIRLSFVPKGFPASEPGTIYMENPNLISKLKNMVINRVNEEVSLQGTPNAYGDFMGVYSTIFNENGEGIGIVVLEVDTKEIDEFRVKMTTLAIIISALTFGITTLAAFFLARYFTRPLEILSSAVENLASGNLIMIENFDKKDEFGNLAKSFNVMVDNLKIASEVQYNLIVEISNFNESLEKKVVERTRTIKEQSQELEKQIMIAKKIQLSLLPEDVPKINGASLSFRYQPMMGVGGDFIDFDYKNEDDLLLFICDVSGHGVPAAFLATMVKMSLQDCYELKLGPSDSLKKIHRALQGKLSGHFLSAVYCHINLKEGIMKSASAGHLPILKVGMDGDYELINSKGRIICEAFSVNSEEVKTNVKIGDKIILYTDGITEARNKNQEMFGDKRLIDISLQYHFDSSSDLCNKIYDSVLSFTGNSQSQFTDDITILVAEYKGRENVLFSTDTI